MPAASQTKPKPKNAPKTPPKGAWPADRIERLPVASLSPYARNARLHSEDQIAQIAKSMERVGFTNPIIVDYRGELIAGHGRLMAAMRLGYDAVPGVRLRKGEWSAGDVAAYRIWDNQSALMSDWSPEFLGSELKRLESSGFDVSLTGFTQAQLVSFTSNVNVRPPDGFNEIGENISTEHSCPKCGYRWSGNPDAAGAAKRK